MSTTIPAQKITIIANGFTHRFSCLNWWPENDPGIDAYKRELEEMPHLKSEGMGEDREWTVEIPEGMTEDEVFWWAQKRMWVSTV